MLFKRRTLAEEKNLNADVIEKLYRDLVNHFIDQELTRFENGINDF